MKTRSDSMWAKLDEKQRDELMTLLSGGASLADGVALLAHWGVKGSVAAVSRSYAVNGFRWKLERAKAAADAVRDSGEGYAEATRSLLERKAFECVASVDIDPRVLVALRAQELKMQDLRLAERRVEILEKKFAACAGALQEGGLSDAERVQRMREAMGC